MISLNPNFASEAVEMALNFGCGIEPLESLPQHLLLKPQEAAEYCRVDKQTLSKARRAGSLRAHILGTRTLRYRVSDLLQYLCGKRTK